MILSIGNVVGLGIEEQAMLNDLVNVYNQHIENNKLKEKYYDGAITLNDVNLGIALPKCFSKLKVGCDWGAKTVDVLAQRSMFDGFVSSSGETIESVNTIIEYNNLIAEYKEACKDELKFGCVFATLSASDGNCKIRFHSPQTASALWDGEKGHIKCGMTIIDTVQDEAKVNTWNPSHINLYTSDAIYEIISNGNKWYATKYRHIMGEPLMVPLTWSRALSKPFGRSRIKKPIRSLIDGYIRTIGNATIGLEFMTTPQKYILGVTEEQYEQIVSDKFKQYVGSIIAATQNYESGQNPTFGQLPQGSLNPHVEMLRMLATQFSAATGLSVVDTGVVNEANPTSSDALEAQSKSLVALAEDLNASNGTSLKKIIKMAQAIISNVSYDELTDEQNDIIAHFKNPSMPSVSATADAAIKISSARPSFSDTDIFLEMVGFSQADIRRIKGQEQRARGRALLQQLNEDNNANIG